MGLSTQRAQSLGQKNGQTVLTSKSLRLNIGCMIRTQIQLPDPLYRDVQRIAREQDWSIAEVMRRGAEAVTRAYPATKSSTQHWRLPPPIQAVLLVSEPAALRDLAQADAERLQ